MPHTGSVNPRGGCWLQHCPAATVAGGWSWQSLMALFLLLFTTVVRAYTLYPTPESRLFMNTRELTIGRLAKAAGVGVETVRYYQQRGLLSVPPRRGAFRYYPQQAVGRIRFIKRAQELGFSLDE